MKSLMNSRLILGVCLVLASFGLSSGAVAQGLPKADLTVERMYQYPLIQGRSPSAPSMAPDGHKVAFGWNTTGIRKLDLYVVDFPNGKPKRIVEASTIKDLPRQDDSRKEDDKKEAELYDAGR